MPSRINLLFLIDGLGATLGGAERILLSLIRTLPQDRFSCVLVTFALEPSSAIAQEPPCPLYVLSMRRTYGAAAIRNAIRLREILRRHEVHIVHTFFESSDIWGGIVAKASGRKVISSRRDMGILRSGKHRIAYRLLAPIYDKVLAVSEEVRRICIEQDRLSPQQVVTVHNGVDMEAIAARATPDCPHERNGNSPIVTTVANVRHVKGIDLLVEIASRVKQNVPGVAFLVVGAISERDYFAKLQATIGRLGLENTVRFLGSQDNVIPILKQSDVFCLPSRSEGMSNALLEAMCCSLPSVVSRVGGNPELIEHGSNGFVFEQEDPDDAATRILVLLGSPSLRAQMGAAAFERVSSHFQFGRMVENITQLYEDVASKR